METRRLRDRVGGMPVESSPEWLPDGWTMDVKNTRHGKYRYYISTLSGCTFQSKEEVLHHLGVVKNDSSTSGAASCSDESKNQLVGEMKESPEWLPSGWILEIKTRRSGIRAGKTYKCYFEQFSGNRFYSKGEVLRFLSSGKMHDRTEKKHLNRNSADNVIAHIEYSPDGLPNGWIKETKFRDSNGGLRKNPYYTDPINGYVFNSLKDAIRYVETGHVSKHAYKPKRSVREVYSFNNDSPSTGSAKKLKSQPTAKKCHITEEILDSNGQFSETVTFPNRLLLSPSSQENVKEEGEERPESATMSPPSPVNPRERAPKNGRIPKTKCTRKSNTKLTKEKADMESEESIKQEEVNEKPSYPSNQPVIDTQPDGKELAKHTEEEEIQEGQSKPGFTNSKEKSKDEREVALEVQKNMSEKLPMVSSNETSQDLLGDELELIVPKQKSSPEKASPSVLEKELELPAVLGKPSTSDFTKPKHVGRKTKAMNAISTPRRSSKRLDSIEIDNAIDVDMGGEHVHESQCKDAIDVLEEPSQRQNNIEDRVANTAMEDVSTTTMDWPEFPATSPFGDSWADPCLEFAFKTLTGDLPVLDDAVAIQEYFQQQLFSVESSSPDVFAPLSNDRTEAAPAPAEVEVKLPAEQDIMQERCQSGVMEKK